MRQLIIQVPQGFGGDVLDIAKSLEGQNLAQFAANNGDEPIDVVIVHVSNRRISKSAGKFITM
jgi:hypothetical protein